MHPANFTTQIKFYNRHLVELLNLLVCAREILTLKLPYRTPEKKELDVLALKLQNRTPPLKKLKNRGSCAQAPVSHACISAVSI